MSKSYRIRTKVGVDTSIKVLIDQEFEHLEILSLKILQTDIYTRQCADYGVIVGRVSVNNGFGVPNAKVSIFIPLDSKDQADPIISELYPYKSLLDNNDDGYRYNLLPYKPSYSAHVPTGTFFTRTDVLTNPTLIEVYDKYYKYNAVTNESGDYMIFGVPVGAHLIVLDVDLSDIGEFSLSPQDLIRMGIATEAQVSGTNFKSSNNLRELPQIVSVNRSVEVEPLWGQPEICNLGITRTDFDLSSEANVDIRPTSIFMGSIISDSDTNAVKSNCKPTNRSGYQCSLTTGPGEILAIRQTIQQNSSGYPILENFSLEGGGKVIDENGTWLIDVPMNMDYYTTNEFGEQVLSNDPEVGIPTKAKYRFKVKWAQSPSLSDITKRAYYLVPNIREYTSFQTESYAFSVDWADYGDAQMIQDAINCDDKFYMMQYNKVYTVSEFIDNHKKGGGTERYVGIKNILEESCESENNRFPTNDGNFRFDILYIIFMFFSIILTPVFFALILLLHILYFVVWLLRIIVLPGLIVWCLASIVNYGLLILGCVPYALGMIAGYAAMIVIYLILSILLYYILRKLWEIDLKGIKVPILTYPDCDLCSCTQGQTVNEEPDPDGAPNDDEDKLLPCPTIFSDKKPISPLTNGLLLAAVSTFAGFKLPSYNAETNPNGFSGQLKSIFANDFAGYTFDGQYGSSTIGAPYLQSEITTTGSGGDTLATESDWFTNGLPLADRINLFNVKAKYFDDNPATNPGGGVNRISVNFETGQTQYHLDNVIVILCDKSTAKKFAAGQMISFQNPSYTKDPNLSGGIKNKFNNRAITGTTFTGNTTVQVKYANPSVIGTSSVGSMLTSPNYNITITATSTTNLHKFPIDIEYFQVITGMTYSSFSGMCVNMLPNSLNKKYFANDTTFFKWFNNQNSVYYRITGALSDIKALNSMTYVRYVNDNYVVILNRGVDPYTPKIPIEYGVGKLFGHNSESAVKIKGFYHMNIPIQGSFKNISHDSGERASTTPLPAWTPLPSGGTSNFVLGQTWVGGNSVTVGGNVNNENAYAIGQQLYFNSFSYCDNQKEIWEYVTGYTNGLTATTWTQKTSRFSGFNSNLISYYSNLDNRSVTLGYKPTCNNIIPTNGTPNSADDEATPKPQTPPIGGGAYSSGQGVKISTNNGFTLAWSRTPSYIATPEGTYPRERDCNFVNYPWMRLPSGPSRYYSITGRNEGYIPNEIVEGASMLHMQQYIPTGPSLVGNGFNSCWAYVQIPRVYSYYYSPIYATTANTMNFTLGSVGTNTFQGWTGTPMSNNQIVMRGDRLPTSTNVEEYCCNGRVLQKNSKFAIYQIPEKGVVGINSVAGPSGSVGNGSLDDVRQSLGGSPKINQVINTFTCDGSVNLECYGCDRTNSVNRTILIRPRGNPCLEFNGETIFEGGCYIFITTIFISLLRDWELMFEWIARNMVMLGACRNVFSHRFNNNWVNGVLYAFAFKNEVSGFSSPTDNPPNVPNARYCYDIVTYHNPSRSYYYRCSPYDPNSGEFSGPLKFPTTIMDLGPRADFLQELVMSDEYDGYLVDRLTTSTYSHVDEILNLFIVSRFMDNNFLNNALGALNIFAYFQNNRDGRYLIDADYAQLISINSELGVAPFQASNYPDAPTVVGAGGFETGIRYKILSGGTASNPTDFTLIGSSSNAINTLFIATGPGSGSGTANVDPQIQNPIFFDCDNSLGIFFSSDTQIRDYVTPKRTIINPTGTTASYCTFNNFAVYSQQVPLSQWFIDAGGNKGSIFGGESNDWKYDTIYSSKYQSLDRLSKPSRYFRSKNQSQNNFLKGYIYAVTNGGSLPTTQNNSITGIITNWDRNTSDQDFITVGAPFHFYFGLKRGASSFDRFRTKWINTSKIVN